MEIYIFRRQIYQCSCMLYANRCLHAHNASVACGGWRISCCHHWPLCWANVQCSVRDTWRHCILTYPVVNWGSDKRSVWGTHIPNKYSLLNGSRLELLRVSQPSNSLLIKIAGVEDGLPLYSLVNHFLLDSELDIADFQTQPNIMYIVGLKRSYYEVLFNHHATTCWLVKSHDIPMIFP